MELENVILFFLSDLSPLGYADLALGVDAATGGVTADRFDAAIDDLLERGRIQRGRYGKLVLRSGAPETSKIRQMPTQQLQSLQVL